MKKFTREESLKINDAIIEDIAEQLPPLEWDGTHSYLIGKPVQIKIDTSSFDLLDLPEPENCGSISFPIPIK